MLQAIELRKTFNAGTVNENYALRGINLTINEGEFITVIGSNGAGKSTFLNAISGDLIVDQGQLLIASQDVTRRNAWQRGKRRGIGRRAIENNQAVCMAYRLY